MIRSHHLAVAALPLLLLTACPTEPDVPEGDDDDAAPVELTGESSLFDPRHDGGCNHDHYWPVSMSANPLFLARFDAPEPPYEIRNLQLGVYSNDSGWGARDCNSGIGVRLFAYVDASPDPTVHTAAPDALPDMPADAEVTVIGDGEEFEHVVVLDGVLDPPVRIEESGYLWVGYEFVEQSFTNLACAAGCGGTGPDPEPSVGWSWVLEGNGWDISPGWHDYGEIPDVRVVLGVPE